MGKLLTAAQFRKARDQVALESMTARLAILQGDLSRLYSQYITLRYELLNTKDRNRIDALNYALYIKPSGEFGDEGGIAWQWQKVAAQIGDIERDSRYRNHK